MVKEEEVGLMPVITFNKKYLYSLLGSGIDEQKLDDHVAKLGFRGRG